MRAIPVPVPWPVVMVQTAAVLGLAASFAIIVLLFKWWTEKPMGYPTGPRPKSAAPHPFPPRPYDSLTTIIQEGNRHDRELAAAASHLMESGGGSVTLPFEYREVRFANTIDSLLAEADTRDLLLYVGQCDGGQTTVTVSKEGVRA